MIKLCRASIRLGSYALCCTVRPPGTRDLQEGSEKSGVKKLEEDLTQEEEAKKTPGEQVLISIRVERGKAVHYHPIGMPARQMMH